MKDGNHRHQIAEPSITINGTQLTPAQAMALRVAATSFSFELDNPVFITDLGPIGPLYRQRISEVLTLMLRGL